MFTIWKKIFADTPYMDCSYNKGQDISKSSFFFKKKATLTIIGKKEILNDRSLRLV